MESVLELQEVLTTVKAVLDERGELTPTNWFDNNAKRNSTDIRMRQRDELTLPLRNGGQAIFWTERPRRRHSIGEGFPHHYDSISPSISHRRLYPCSPDIRASAPSDENDTNIGAYNLAGCQSQGNTGVGRFGQSV